MGILLAAVLGIAGIVAVGTASQRTHPSPRFTAPTLDHFLSWDSFSEVEQTKSLLQGLCLQSIALIRRDYLRSRHLLPPSASHPDSGTASAVSHDPALHKAIDRLRQRIDEFAGTSEAVTLQGELLRLYRRGGADEEWLDLYLEVLYTHPDRSLVIMERAKALELGHKIGRDAEVRAALDHWAQIPSRYLPTGATAEPAPPQARAQ